MKNKVLNLKKRALAEVKTDQDLVLLTILSSLLASLGIKMGNTYVLIGAMLISPLFDPILSLVVLSFIHDKKSFWKSLRSLSFIALLALGTSVLFWMVVYILGGSDILIESSSIVSWENFLVAILMGIVGMLLWIWPKINNTGVGIAMAISLVPPIAYTSYYFVYGYFDISFSHFILFNVNLAGMLLGGELILALYKKGRYKMKL